MKAESRPSQAPSALRTITLAPSIIPELCTGCGACETACSYAHEGTTDASFSRIRIRRRAEEAAFIPILCLQCQDPPCIPACPAGARWVDPESGLVRMIEESCIGCASCVGACPAGAIRMDPRGERALSCDACGGDPVCESYCEPGALSFLAPHAGARKRASVLARRSARTGGGYP